MPYTHGYRRGDNLLSTGSQASLHHLKYSLHVEWIALNPFAHQHAHNAPGIRFGDAPPTSTSGTLSLPRTIWVSKSC